MSPSENKANILYIAHDTGLIGGAERQLLELFKGIDRDTYAPYLVCLETGGPVAEGARELGVPVEYVTRSWRWDLGVALRLKSLIKRERISIVHAYLGLPGFYGAIAGKLSGVKVITTIRIAGPRTRLSDVSERFAFLISDTILSNSRAGADYYFKHFPGRHKARVIYNGYNPSEFDQVHPVSKADLGLPEDGLVIGHVANLTYLKDYPTFLQALARVFRIEPRALALIVGDGAKRDDYESLARFLGISEHTFFLGHRRDVLSLVSAFDVGVLASHPSYSEGLSNSIAEYMGMSRPVVATAVGGNRELVADGVSGFLTPPGEPEPLADRIVELLENDDLRQRMGKQGRKFFEENLSLQRMVSETQRVYQGLLGR
jgi:glycosyltransferase involved in cell wall biosynthesis